MRWLFADWNGNKGHIFDAVKAGLYARGDLVEVIPRSCTDRRSELVSAIRSGEFDALLTWQRYYPMQRDIISAAAESKIQTVFMDFGFFPHYQTVVFDRKGENASSSWLEHWQYGEPPDTEREELEAAEALMKREASRARLLEWPLLLEAEQITHPFVFVPLQRPGDSVVKYDSTVHDFGELLRRILLLARGRFFVVCKTHPLDTDLGLGVPDFIKGQHIVIRETAGSMNEAMNDYLLSKAALVVGVNSNMLFRSMLFGTPTIALGRGWYSGSGAIYERNGLQELDNLSAPIPHLAQQRQYIARCLSRQLLFKELTDPDALFRVLRRIGIRLDESGSGP